MRAFPIAAVVAVSLLAGCAVAPPPGATPTPTPTPSPTPTFLSEEPVTLKVGVPVDLSATRGLAKATVTVERIQENAECESGEETPDLGQFVAVTVSARQGADASFDFSTYEWLTVGVDGEQASARAKVVTARCVPAGDRLGATYTAGRVKGTVLLDAPTALARILVRNTLAVPPVTVTIELPPR